MITLVIGGQYGSEGKGSVVSWLAARKAFDLAIRTGGSNAGHTFKSRDGAVHKMQQLPCTWSEQPRCPLYIPAGAVISKERFELECELVHPTPVWVSSVATVITDEAKALQRGVTTGSTFEGVGGARALKCIKRATIARDVGWLRPFINDSLSCRIIGDPQSNILIESTQGYALSLDGYHYPYCASGNLTPYRLLDDAEIPFGLHDVEVWLVFRTYPIRIAGNSGPLWHELTWDELRRRHGEHIPTEQTTVTKKTRRVGEFDMDLAREALRRTRPNQVVLTFADYIFPQLAETGVTREVNEWLAGIEDGMGCRFDWLGIGIGRVIPRSPIGTIVTDDDGEP